MKKKLIALMFLATLMAPQRSLAFDAREVQLRLVLERYHSPLVGLEGTLISTAEKYGMDWTTLAAIAGTESSFAKRMPCNNPFGWGITGSKRICFASLEEAIIQVGKGIGTKYNTSSLETIGRKYNTVNTAGWVSNTRFFANKIKSQPIPVSSLPFTL